MSLHDGAIQVAYVTDPNCASICWMEPDQTAGKTYKFLFTQGQSVLNR